MGKYSRVSYDVRCQIFAYLQINLSISEIARQLGFNKSTIYRELKRNSSRVELNYSPHLAQKKARDRYKRCRRQYVITKKYRAFIRSALHDDWSPEQIAGRLRLEFGEGPCTQTIYHYIRKQGYRGRLRGKGRKVGCGRYTQRKRAKKNGLNIKQRPIIANERRRIGDWERDTMHTLNGVQLLVCTDRKSRFTKVDKVEKRTSYDVGVLTASLLKEAGRTIYTITNDNGGDFKGKSNLKYRIYFCDPMKPQQRGTVENTIGLLRQYIKRKTDVGDMKKQDFRELERKLNYRPRKILNYKTPFEVYYDKKLHWQL